MKNYALTLIAAALFCLVALPADAQLNGPHCEWHTCGEHGSMDLDGECPQHMNCRTDVADGNTTQCVSCWVINGKFECTMVDPDGNEDMDHWFASSDCLGPGTVLVWPKGGTSGLSASGAIGSVTIHGAGGSSSTMVTCAGSCVGPLCSQLNWTNP